eukprot:7810322-Lingulodinium_polyedra.AAC.1
MALIARRAARRRELDLMRAGDLRVPVGCRRQVAAALLAWKREVVAARVRALATAVRAASRADR